jgi:hypothetical protein
MADPTFWLAVGSVVLKFLGFLSGQSAQKAALAIQKAQFALDMAKSADDEKVARRRVKRATDQANQILAKSNLKDKYESALQGLADKGVVGAQEFADDFAKERTGIGKEKFGAEGDTRREDKLALLKDARKKDMIGAVGDEASIGGQFSGAGVRGMPSQWANAYNASAKRIHGEMGTRAGLRAALGSTQDMDLMTAQGMTGLKGADLAERAMGTGWGIDQETARGDLEKEGRGISAEFAQKGHDIDFGYTLPETVIGPMDESLGRRLSKAQGKQAMYTGMGDIASSMSKWDW